ncbi:MAG TPA: DmsC/YnfH family molybdoenzyme membrane anchor subunit [Nitrospiria bacterium]|nr:DmsC/YnfH family molybdoenzyme membrane anchor subunit [Nitrospiria bacterium]
MKTIETVRGGGGEGAKEISQHGTPIDLSQSHPDLVGHPLTINGCGAASSNPNRYQQHGFHFTADNCIACHACESACSEKNNLPPHLSFRKVGYLEGGSYPDVLRLNISMACNHCENPVCLKGCPTLAYTKYVEYGAVLQDPDICFGCGYCTWVCPYNAPQLDPVKGQVEKCNMCVDRLEIGLKPACVSACLSNALDFGVIERLPQGKQQAKLAIPGFPDPSISRPNIRFQQTRSLPGEFRRADGEPLAYRRDQPGVDRFTAAPGGSPAGAEWGLAKLRSREDPLVVFTLLSQAVVGAFMGIVVGPWVGREGGAALSATAHPFAVAVTLWGLFGLQTLGMVMSTLHLGKPQYFYRAMNNLRHSWVSREILTMGTFYHLLGALAAVTAFPGLIAWLPVGLADRVPWLLGWSGVLAGGLGLYSMTRCYRIKARPFWDHWHSGGAFASSAMILGSATVGAIFCPAEVMAGHSPFSISHATAAVLLIGLVLQGIALTAHLRFLSQRGDEAAVSRRLMLTTYGKTYAARWVSWAALVIAAVTLMVVEDPGAPVAWLPAAWAGIWLAAVVHELVGRALFYVAVVPTTHPGAFFWGNKVFETHARVSGLANMPQVGVVSDGH